MPQVRQRSSLNRVLCIPGAFTEAECTQIIDTSLATWQELPGAIGLGKAGASEHDVALDKDYRNVTIFEPAQPDQWLCEKILRTIVSVNGQENGYGFDLFGMAEPPRVMRYEAADVSEDGKPGKYEWHMDLGSDSIGSTRKISYSILLNPGQYEGGTLKFLVSQEPRTFCDQQKLGTMVIFPSYLMHCVQEVTSGTRYVVVGWVHGNSFC